MTRRVRRLQIPAFAKINLGLEVLGLREDGYHELRTIFQTLDLADDVSISFSSRSTRSRS
jgi:4-diphosphocytidyl-2-C-methyl-D-erythritol kinase